MGYQIFCTRTKGTNFECTIFQQTLEAFEIDKRHTTAYHPQCDGMVERVNRSLLQLLRAYVEKDYEWEHYLPLVLYAYHTAVHTSMGVSPFVNMFGREPRSTDLSPHISFDTNSYQSYLQAKLAELRDFVEANKVQAGAAQKKLLLTPKQNCSCLKKVTLFGCQFQSLVRWEVDGGL